MSSGTSSGEPQRTADLPGSGDRSDPSMHGDEPPPTPTPIAAKGPAAAPSQQSPVAQPTASNADSATPRRDRRNTGLFRSSIAAYRGLADLTLIILGLPLLVWVIVAYRGADEKGNLRATDAMILTILIAIYSIFATNKAARTDAKLSLQEDLDAISAREEALVKESAFIAKTALLISADLCRAQLMDCIESTITLLRTVSHDTSSPGKPEDPVMDSVRSQLTNLYTSLTTAYHNWYSAIEQINRDIPIRADQEKAIDDHIQGRAENTLRLLESLSGRSGELKAAVAERNALLAPRRSFDGDLEFNPYLIDGPSDVEASESRG